MSRRRDANGSKARVRDRSNARMGITLYLAVKFRKVIRKEHIGKPSGGVRTL